jgi:hypothetical protein
MLRNTSQGLGYGLVVWQNTGSVKGKWYSAIGIILKWIFKKYDEVNGLNFFSLGYGQVAGSCEYGNELLVPSNAENFLSM